MANSNHSDPVEESTAPSKKTWTSPVCEDLDDIKIEGGGIPGGPEDTTFTS
ncbi:hypothetical protein IEN85_16480 [Pelagicoccus sp. NFK12]|uniref:Uncharacterized protein n=1 Tax=Pelagicoccus enzymogenes TaxID=2773457 RepID=A0A927F9R1_9BACT|nr:hypothetical protein [Pelagicoccus enzymogenes]MBD5781097.1 hypothetical protein [Pelagicoccus enzymogenes]MDQ8199804.1 hypothetical protein [Pelagicoccus enzymogenes]